MPNYEVGYMKPPIETRFKPGQSGNKTGRPRGSRNTYTIFEKLINAKVFITQDGKQIKITKQEALLMQAINSGLKGNLKAIQSLFPHMLAVDSKKEERAKVHASLHQDDQKIINQFIKGQTNE